MPLKTRLAFLAAAVLVSVGAFVVLQRGDDDATADAGQVHRFAIRGERAVGGEGEVRVRAGTTLRITVASDAPHLLHLHGYDRYASAGPGAPALFALPADLEGVFELEVHETAGAPRIPVARVVVRP